MGETGEIDTWKMKAFRYFILFWICLTTLGSYFCYDLPGALQTEITKWFDIPKTGFKYTLFYSMYSYPNTVLPFIGGFLLDRVFGLRLGCLVFCFFVLGGQALFSLGASFSAYYLSLIGRFVFGLGGESLSVAQSAFAARWYKGKPDMALAFAITISFSRIGSTVNFNVSPKIADSTSVPYALWFGGIICIVSFGACLVLGFLDKKFYKDENADSNKEEEKISLRDIMYFPLSLWIIYAIVVSYYVSIFVWVSIGKDFIIDHYGIDKDTASSVVGLPYLVSAFASPAFGFLVDRTGRNLSWMFVACGLMVLSHVLMMTTHLTPWFTVAVMGVSYSMLAASLWPCLAWLVALHQVGTAYGVSFALQNAGLAIFPTVISAILEASHNNYAYSGLVFTACAGLATSLTLLLIVLDLRDPRLNVSAATIKSRNSKAETLSVSDAPGDSETSKLLP